MVSATISKDYENAFTNVLNKLLPTSKTHIDKTLQQIEQNAKDNWLIRRTKHGRIDYKNTKDSKSKVYAEITISPQKELLIKIGNTAEYAWAIKVGDRSKRTNVREGKRLSNELLWKPIRKESTKIAKFIADDTLNLLKEK